MTLPVPDGVDRTHVLEAARAIDAGVAHRFGDSVRYDVIIEGRRYAPKAVLGIAIERAGHTPPAPRDFRGGLRSPCFRALEALGFRIVPKEATGPIAVEPGTAKRQDNLGERARPSTGELVSLVLEREDGSTLDAALGIGHIGEMFGLVVESHGGGRNTDYPEAIELILRRLQRADCSGAQVRLVSATVLREGAPSGRLLAVGEHGSTWLDLRNRTPAALRKIIGEAVGGVRTAPAARGPGNERKRILIDAGLDARSWQEVLAVSAAPDENPSSDARTGRERVLASITARRGQRAFRQALLRAYEGRCAVTGTDAEAVLEAAHIRPYDGSATNRVANGLLLRADIHTLFDLDLLRIDAGGRVTIDSVLREPAYRELDGCTLRRPADPADWPDPEELAARAER